MTIKRENAFCPQYGANGPKRTQPNHFQFNLATGIQLTSWLTAFFKNRFEAKVLHKLAVQSNNEP